MTPTLKRVLVLHGFSQNSIIMNKRLGALRKECKDIEFVIPNATHILLPSDLPGSVSQFDSESSSTYTDPNSALRSWWKANRERNFAAGIEESIIYIKEILMNQRFDGVFGFSQGAAFAGLISALLERPELYSPFLVDGKPPHPPFEFCVSISGFKVIDPLCDRIFVSNYSTPTLHVIGKTDVVVVEERSLQLVEVSNNARVEEHDGGHFVPSKGTWRKFLWSYMRDPLAAHPSPSLPSPVEAKSSSSTPGSFGDNYRSALLKL